MRALGWLGAAAVVAGLVALVVGLVTYPTEVGGTFVRHTPDAVTAGVTLTTPAPDRRWFEIGTGLVALGGLVLVAWSVRARRARN